MRAILLAAALAVLAPVGAASGSPVLWLSSPEDARLAGDVAVVAAGGTLQMDDVPGGEWTLSGFTGDLTVWSWQALHHRLPTGQEARQRVGDATSETFTLRNATLSWTGDGGARVLDVVAREGGVLAAPAEPGAGRPTVSTLHVGAVPGGSRDAGAPEDVGAACDAGWPYAGTHLGTGEPGFPRVHRARVDGPADVQLFGGRLSFVDATGQERAVRLGSWRDDAAAGPLPGDHPVTRWQRAVFRGEVAGAEVPVAGRAMMCAPAMAWRVDGALEWTDATGEARREGQEPARFEGARVVADGALDVALAPGLAGDARYEARGEWRSLRVDGAALVAPPPREATTPQEALSWAALALAFLVTLTARGQQLLGGLVAALYTRLRPSDVLEHPRRRAILDLVRAEPGIHLRELHRRVGGAWGPFNYHVRTLVDAGQVVARKSGRYDALHAPDAALTPDALLPPRTRAVFAALPADGSPVELARLCDALAMSRPLLRYHLGVLRERDLAGFTAAQARRRAAPAPGEPAASPG